MTETKNGNQYWVRWLVASLYGVLVFAMTSIVNGVINNDKEARARDISITADLNQTKVEVKSDIASIKTGIEAIKENNKAMFEMQKNILRELKS
jgi:hypothetical protein